MQESVKRDAFVFYRSFFECLENLAEEDKAAAYEMFCSLCLYALDGTEPELKGSLAAIFSAIKPNLDASRKKAEAGSKGGKTASKTEADASKTEADASKTEADASKPEKPQAIKSKTRDKGQETRDKEQEIKDKGQETSPQSPPEAVSEYCPEFEKFWTTYPRKLNEGEARKMYAARVKEGYTPAQLATAAKSYAEECKAAHTEERYIKHPRNFLNDVDIMAAHLRKAEKAAEPDTTPEEMFAEWAREAENDNDPPPEEQNHFDEWR